MKKKKFFWEKNGSNDSVRLQIFIFTFFLIYYVANPFGRCERLLIVHRLNGVVSTTIADITKKFSQQNYILKHKKNFGEKNKKTKNYY